MQLNEMSNNQLLLELKKLELEHDSLKQKIVDDLDKLAKIEKDYADANKILNDRLKHE